MNADSIIVKKYKSMNRIVNNKIISKLPLKLKKLILLRDYNKKVKKHYMGKFNFAQSMLDLYSIVNANPGRSYRLETKDYPVINISARGEATLSIYSDNIFSIQLIWYGSDTFTYDYYDSSNNRYSGAYTNDNDNKEEIATFYETIVYETLEYIFYNLFKEYFLLIRNN